MAFFSAEWLAEQFDMNVVMVIRHPAAFVSSIKKLGWQHPFSHFLEQSALMSAYLSAFEREIRMYASKDHDLIDQGILALEVKPCILYCLSTANYIRTGSLCVMKILSRNPVEAFRKLYNQLDLEFSEKTQKVVESYSAATNPSETDASVGSEENPHAK